MVDVLLGLQWGDEGKGKIVDALAKNYQIIARFQGGPNAGHTLYINDKKIVLHTIPSGIFHPHLINVIGNGVVLDPISFKQECNEVQAHVSSLHQQLIISQRAHLILPTHKALDKANEIAKGKLKIGSTLKGIGPTYMDKIGRNGLRVGDILKPSFLARYTALKEKHVQLLKQLSYHEDIKDEEEQFFQCIENLKQFKIIAIEYYLNQALNEGKKILAEGAQGTMLDVDFGTYPFVTSSSTITPGVCTGLGIAPQKIDKVFGISKAYCTRVGSGPFPTELENQEGETLRKNGNEFGSTTGRPRRCGWIDLVALQYACIINGVTELFITKTDVLDGFSQIKACTAYTIDNVTTNQFPYHIEEGNITPKYHTIMGWNTPLSKATNSTELPAEFLQLITLIEEYCNLPIKIISNGVGRDQLIYLT